jgi:RNA polymerase sigma factor (sigma-70 family)
MSLKTLSKNDELWRKFARKISGDKNTADDLVQEMYLKLCKVEKTLESFYVYMTMRSIFHDMKRKNSDRKRTKKELLVDQEGFFDYYTDPVEVFEADDRQNRILEEFEKLPFHQKELILESYDKSLRGIEKEFNINYGFIYREIKKAREAILKNGQKN